MIPLTRLHLFHSNSWKNDQASNFLRRQIPLRVAYANSILDENAHTWGAKLRSESNVRQALQAMQQRYDASTIQASLYSFVEDHRRLVSAHRGNHAAARMDALTPGEISLNRLQYNVFATHVLCEAMQRLIHTDHISKEPGKSVFGVRRCNMREIVDQIINDVRPFAVEKFGVCAPIEVHSASSSTASSHQQHSFIGVGEFMAYSITEVLKNAISAMITRYTAANVDDAEPIRLTVHDTGRHVLLEVQDYGGGLGDRIACKATYPYFESRTQQRQEPNYQYSREFGTPFSGYGLGLVRTQLFARYHGGDVELIPTPGKGCIARLFVEKAGMVAVDIW